jgi:hypothetical protein
VQGAEHKAAKKKENTTKHRKNKKTTKPIKTSKTTKENKDAKLHQLSLQNTYGLTTTHTC